jgi:hypothetical protein
MVSVLLRIKRLAVVCLRTSRSTCNFCAAVILTHDTRSAAVYTPSKH